MAKYTAKLLDAIESFPDHLLELARDVETVRQRLSEAMGSSGFDVSFGRTAKDLASSAVSLSKELRAWKESIKVETKELSLEEKSKFVLKFLQSLSVGDRIVLYTKLAQLEVSRPDKVSITVNESLPGQKPTKINQYAYLGVNRPVGSSEQ